MKQRWAGLGLWALWGLVLAQSAPDWLAYAKGQDGTLYSWNRSDVASLDTWFYEVGTRAQFPSPQPIPSRSDLPPMSTAYIRYRINCATGNHLPVAASYRDGNDEEIVHVDVPGRVIVANPSGDKRVDWLQRSFCAGRFQPSRPGSWKLP